MFNYELPRDQHLLQLRIGIERPIPQFARDFFIPGQPQRGLPLVTLSAEADKWPAPSTLASRGTVPLIHLRRGVIRFATAKWGAKTPDGDTTDLFRRAERRTLGFPALIPASFVDIALGPHHPVGDTHFLRVRSDSEAKNLYLGCTYTNDRLADAQTVKVLVLEAGPDFAPYVDWQPLLISVAAVPMLMNFDFLLGRDKGRLQRPSPSRSVKAEIVSASSEMAA
jgi:hypothetical protein